MAVDYFFDLRGATGVLSIPKRFWIKLGQWIINTVRRETQQGIMQTDEPWKATYSQKYKELKANNFRVPGKTKKGKPTMVRMAQYRGVSIASTNTAYVDMTATGQTLRGFQIVETTENSVVLSYAAADIWKIIGNQKPGLNRRIVGLRAANRDAVTDMFVEMVTDETIKKIVGKKEIRIKL
ncbi:MAG: hypothetical protein LC115_08185 [Bacteroidia bacterium]|nr:hypothetical protein [Chitinophagaceae bacterium]MCZ2356650.1 hypothetical protein [Bacteroidia bacterium]